MKRLQSGFTLIEIAIVLVIIGLLLGGVLKGQELITGARVRNLIQQQDGVKAAYFGFLDRFRALPGDYSQATVNITGINVGAGACGATPGNGNGDGQILTATANEDTLVWEHLSKAGFINGTYTCATGAPSQATSPTNPYGQPLVLMFDATYFAAGAGAPPNRHNLKTGRQIPSDIMAEIDRKVDDGNPAQGSFRASTATATCYTTGTPATWIAQNPIPDCQGATIF
jgi:prepilin-type N-terminal cleavage/methylation domain-containing protein